jgi:2-hydroxy-3-keto-5-methylthiopentenyl-1-phosphate phosphatase
VSGHNGRKPLIYFCDFDGTIAVKDIGNELQKRFSHPRWRTPNRAYLSGKITSRDCLWSQFEFFRANRQEVQEFVLGHELDPGFADFARWSREVGIPLVILSDGLGFYIKLLLEKNGLEGFACYSNEAHFEADRARIEFPYYRPDCSHGCGCGNCKPGHMEDYRNYEKVYVGDGISDRFAALEADRVYAKKLLVDYCRDHGIEHISYQTFHDVLEQESRQVQKEVTLLGEQGKRA